MAREVYYSDYLQLDRLLHAQQPESDRAGQPAHDEMLFIIVHQIYELWFKQILHELNSVIELFQKPTLDDHGLGTIVRRLQRVLTIQGVLIDQIQIIETITPLDFLDFRDYLVPSSGFQSRQFKEIEIRLGLKRADRIEIDRQAIATRLRLDDRQQLDAAEREPSLFALVEAWLERMPFLVYGDFDFWQHYRGAVDSMLREDAKVVEQRAGLSEPEKERQRAGLASTRDRFDRLLSTSGPLSAPDSARPTRISRRAMLAAVFINLYRDMPLLYLPFRLLTHLLEIDEQFTVWRQRHAIMVQRMLGTKIGTGGSTGHDYLSQTAQNNRVFVDLFELSTFLIPRSALPTLPAALEKQLGFYFSGSPSPPPSPTQPPPESAN